MSDTVSGTSQTGTVEDTSVIEYCGRCDTRLVPNANFCHHCGAQVLRPNTKSMEPPPPSEPRTTSGTGEPEPTGPTELQETGEATLWEGRPSKRAILAGLLRGALIGGLAVAAYRWIAGNQNWPGVPGGEFGAGAIVAAMGLLFALRPLLRVWSHRYAITSRSIWVEEGILQSSKTGYPLTCWAYIHVRQSFLQRLMGTGDIELEPANPAELPLLLQDVENVHNVTRTLDSAIATARKLKKKKPTSQHSQRSPAVAS